MGNEFFNRCEIQGASVDVLVAHIRAQSDVDLLLDAAGRPYFETNGGVAYDLSYISSCLPYASIMQYLVEPFGFECGAQVVYRAGRARILRQYQMFGGADDDQELYRYLNDDLGRSDREAEELRPLTWRDLHPHPKHVVYHEPYSRLESLCPEGAEALLKRHTYVEPIACFACLRHDTACPACDNSGILRHTDRVDWPSFCRAAGAVTSERDLT